MSPASENVLQQAMALSPAEREAVAEQLLRSLEVDSDWVVEFERRVREVRDGTAELIDGEEVFADIAARLRARREER